MNYIILDLEWNDAYFKKINGFMNEIVEIGAIKLNENFEIVDEFSVIVKSAITKRLSTRFKNLTGMTNEQMQAGELFADALKLYKEWVGEESLTFTWSDSDLYTLYNNCQYFTDSAQNAAIGKYVDLQKFFQHKLYLSGVEQKNQISLSNAAALLEINVDQNNLHHALDDSLLAAEILKQCYDENLISNFIIDTSDDAFFKKLVFKPYFIKDINSDLIDKNKISFACPACKGNTKRVSGFKFVCPWFHTKVYCSKCNTRYKAAICFKRHFEHTQIKKKIFMSLPKKENTNSANNQKAPVKE